MQAFLTEKYLHLSETHARWYASVIDALCNSNKKSAEKIIHTIDDLRALLHEWAARCVKEGLLDEGGKDFILQLQKEMAEEALKKQDTKNLVSSYVNFTCWLNRLYQDCIQAEQGIDGLTGLGTEQTMYKDLKRELERRSRNGKHFCIALARIDNIEVLRQEKGNAYAEQAMQEVAALFKKEVRSFDDVYRLDEDNFSISLKHAQQQDGISFIERIRLKMEGEPIKITIDGSAEITVTLSYTVFEPMPGDDVRELIRDAAAELKKQSMQDEEVTLRYEEISPLQRYLDDIGAH